MLLHVVGHLAEPHDIGAQAAGFAAGGAGELDGEVGLLRPPGMARLTVVAQRLAMLAVHVDEVLGARGLVQGIDVLRDDQT